MADTKILDVIDALYAAAYDGSAWTQVGPALAAAFGSETAQITLLRSNAVEALATTPAIVATLPAYLAYYHKMDLWLQGGLARPLNRAYVSNEFIADSDLLRTEMYTDCLSKMGSFYCLGGVLSVEGDTRAMLGIHHPRGQPFSSDAEGRTLEMLMPHIIRAAQIGRRLAQADTLRSAAQAAIDRITIGVIILGADGRPALVNDAADRVLCRPGSGLSLRFGRLEPTDPAAASRLARLVREAACTGAGQAGSAGGVLHLPAAPGRRPVSLLVCPLPARTAVLGAEQPGAIVFVSDPEQAAPSRTQPYADILAGLYGLTPAEARVASALAEGESLPGYAGRAGLSLHTVRSQLKQVLAKTDCRSQAELLRILPRFQ